MGRSSVVVWRRQIAGRGTRTWDPDRKALHLSAGQALRLPFRIGGDHDGEEAKPLCARVDGFSLHAARSIEPGDREGLELSLNLQNRRNRDMAVGSCMPNGSA